MLVTIKNKYTDILSKQPELYAKDLGRLMSAAANHSELLSVIQLSGSPPGKYFAFAVKAGSDELHGLVFITTVDNCEIAIAWLPPYRENFVAINLVEILNEYNLNFIIMIADERYAVGNNIPGNWFLGGHVSYSSGYSPKHRKSDKPNESVDISGIHRSFASNIASILDNRFYYFNLATSYGPLLKINSSGILESNPPINTIFDTSNDWETIYTFLQTQSIKNTYKIFHRYPFNYPGETPVERVNIYTHSTIKWAIEPMKAEAGIALKPE